MLAAALAVLPCRLAQAGTRLGVRTFLRGKATEAGGGAEKAKPNKITFDVGGTKQTYDVVNVQAEANTFYNSFHSLRGQKAVGGLWILASVGAFIYQTIGHTVCQDWVKGVYQSYTFGLAAKVKPDVVTLANKVLVDMAVTGMEGQGRGVELFVCTLPEPRGWGEAGSCLLGYPGYYHYTDPSQVPLGNMRFGGGGWKRPDFLQPKQLDMPEARRFCEAMVLTGEAKQFGLAREVARVQAMPHFYMAILNSCWILLTYNLSRFLNKKLGMFTAKQAPIKRGLMYQGVLLWSVVTYLQAKDLANRRTERRAVSAAVALGPEYARGGREYYGKMLLRNRCMKAFEPELNTYNLEGELMQGVIRTKFVPIKELMELCSAESR